MVFHATSTIFQLYCGGSFVRPFDRTNENRKNQNPNNRYKLLRNSQRDRNNSCRVVWISASQSLTKEEFIKTNCVQ